MRPATDHALVVTSAVLVSWLRSDAVGPEGGYCAQLELPSASIEHTPSSPCADIECPVVTATCEWMAEIATATGQNQRPNSLKKDGGTVQSPRELVHRVGSASALPLAGWVEDPVQMVEASGQEAARVAVAGIHHFEEDQGGEVLCGGHL